jgi:hypothetical protein
MRLSDSYRGDSPAERIVIGVERRIGRDGLAKLFLEFRDENSNNLELSEKYGVGLYDVVTLRGFPWVVLRYLTVARKQSSAVILHFRQSA